MREIKFRAWDTTRNIYGRVIGMSFPVSDNDDNFPNGHKGKLSLFNMENDNDCGFWGIWIEKVILEQHTGINDKNGCEIFHNDIGEITQGLHKWRIVIATIDRCKDGPLYGVEVGCNFSIDDENNRYIWEWSTENNGRRYELPFLDRSFEVIGNIHENPELLKKP